MSALGSVQPGKFIDIETDSRDGDAAVADLFEGDVPVTPTFKSTRGSHRLYGWHPDLEAVGKATIHVGPLEIRLGAGGKAAQSLLPPSVTDGTPAGVACAAGRMRSGTTARARIAEGSPRRVNVTQRHKRVCVFCVSV